MLPKIVSYRKYLCPLNVEDPYEGKVPGVWLSCIIREESITLGTSKPLTGRIRLSSLSSDLVTSDTCGKSLSNPIRTRDLIAAEALLDSNLDLSGKGLFKLRWS
jgi:hypothetical protein